MYAEMLREGWADQGRKQTYYAFICEESERLTRLINNVLQLARLTRNELTRETVGTGIGLALVRELTLAMGGRVNWSTQSPGPSFG